MRASPSRAGHSTAHARMPEHGPLPGASAQRTLAQGLCPRINATHSCARPLRPRARRTAIWALCAPQGGGPGATRATARAACFQAARPA
eukprot:11180011-Lingulodinium_polyedra.AAC.1